MVSLLRYPGGKTKLKTPILKKLNELSADRRLRYVEPFFGGGSIGCEFLKANKDVNDIWMNDFDSALIALWKSVIQHPEYLKEMVSNFVPSVEYFDEYKSVLMGNPQVNDDSILRYGFMKLALHQISYSGLGTKSGGPLGGREQKSNYKIDCRWSPEYICKKIDALHNLFKKLHVQCTNKDFADVIVDDSKDSLVYLDPPYYVKGNALYECGFKEEDHERLADLLRQTKHAWVLSYDDCEEVKELYKWATIEKLSVKYSVAMSKEEIAKNENKKKGDEIMCEEYELLITR